MRPISWKQKKKKHCFLFIRICGILWFMIRRNAHNVQSTDFCKPWYGVSLPLCKPWFFERERISRNVQSTDFFKPWYRVCLPLRKLWFLGRGKISHNVQNTDFCVNRGIGSVFLCVKKMKVNELKKTQ
jgi:hypothetical protein